MPELPEVEVLVRNLRPQLENKLISGVTVIRNKVLKPTTPEQLTAALVGSRFEEVLRRGKYLLFKMRAARKTEPLLVMGHLGMTGRMYLLAPEMPLPKHAAVILELEKERFVFEDMRYFGRFTLDTSPVAGLGPEPLGENFTPEYFARVLKRSVQPIKVKLLDQSIVAGVGNIYAAEALFRANISPKMAARRLKKDQVARLWQAIREILAEAIDAGSTVRFHARGRSGQTNPTDSSLEERALHKVKLHVYDRVGQPCSRCGVEIKRLVQANRSTYFCPKCQK